MTIRFLNTLLQDEKLERAVEGRTYKCESCYRPNLKSNFVSFITHGEAYCNSCVKGASNESR